MKYLLLYFLIISALALSACSKTALPSSDPNPDPDPDPIDTVQHVIELGKVSMKRDGQPWEQPFMAKFFENGDKDYFTIWTEYAYSGLIKETFVIREIPCRPGSYTPERGSIFSIGDNIPEIDLGWVLDGDQVLGGLFTDTLKPDNVIEVLRYDSLNRIVEGTFKFHLINTYPTPNEIGLPNAMHVTDGKFHLKLE